MDPKSFLNGIQTIVESHLDDPSFTVEQFSREACASKAQLHRKITASTGLSAGQYIRSIRLLKARELLSAKSNNITSVAMDCGFSDPSYFGRVFKQTYGMTPREWRGNVVLSVF
jgi:AraC-like DNA-binding protein